MARLVVRSKRPGYYCAVALAGTVETADAMALIGRDEASLTVAQIAALFAGKTLDADLLRRAANLEAIPEGWRDQVRSQLARLDLEPYAVASNRPGSTVG